MYNSLPMILNMETLCIVDAIIFSSSFCTFLKQFLLFFFIYIFMYFLFFKTELGFISRLFVQLIKTKSGKESRTKERQTVRKLRRRQKQLWERLNHLVIFTVEAGR